MLQVIVLGLVQGLTEFLPVSSSGHLALVPWLLGWPQPPLAFDVALHFGTLLAVLAYFASDLRRLATAAAGRATPGAARSARRTVLMLLLASVPAALAGAGLEDFFEGMSDQPRWIALFLVVTAASLIVAERVRAARVRRQVDDRALAGTPAGGAAPSASTGGAPEPSGVDVGRGEETVGPTDALTIGVAQALAIFPGISRSGATIATGMVRGLSRHAAARFSFLMSIPVILGATVLKVGELASAETERLYSNGEVAVGVLVATASGYLAIRWLLKLVASAELVPFAWYVLGVAAFAFGASFVLPA